MSLEKDITAIMKLLEVGPDPIIDPMTVTGEVSLHHTGNSQQTPKKLFKPATPEQVRQRGEAPMFDDKKMQAYYDLLVDDGMSPHAALSYATDVMNSGFTDRTMQVQYMEMILDGEPVHQARAAVIKAHRDYFDDDDAADFHGVPRESREANRDIRRGSPAFRNDQ